MDIDAAGFKVWLAESASGGANQFGPIFENAAQKFSNHTIHGDGILVST